MLFIQFGNDLRALLVSICEECETLGSVSARKYHDVWYQKLKERKGSIVLGVRREYKVALDDGSNGYVDLAIHTPHGVYGIELDNKRPRIKSIYKVLTLGRCGFCVTRHDNNLFICGRIDNGFGLESVRVDLWQN